MEPVTRAWLDRLGPALEWLQKEGGLAGFFHDVAKSPRIAAEVSRELLESSKGFDAQIARSFADFLEAVKLPPKERALRFAEKELDDSRSLDAAATRCQLPAALRASLEAWLALARKLDGPKQKGPLKAGAAVNHRKFGPGTVKSLDGKAAVVEFADGQTIRLDSAYLDW